MYVLEMTGTCWKWLVCVWNDPYVLICIENDVYVLEMIRTYLKWSTRIENDPQMTCVKRVYSKWIGNELYVIERFEKVYIDLIEYYEVQTGANRPVWEIWDKKQCQG